jgi:hypothetical protein
VIYLWIWLQINNHLTPGAANETVSPLAEQKRIVAKIEELFKEIDKLQK